MLDRLRLQRGQDQIVMGTVIHFLFGMPNVFPRYLAIYLLSKLLRLRIQRAHHGARMLR